MFDRCWLLSLSLCLLPSFVHADESTPLKPGVIILVHGAGGMDLGNTVTRWAFRIAQVPHEVREFIWTHGKGQVLRDLQDTRHLVSKAEELARQISEYQAEHPGRPVYLIGRSTGAAIVLGAAAARPDASLEKIILLAPAVSPAYNLLPALRATRTEIVAYRSDYDHFFLGWGTSTFGTADRIYTESAGKQGFQLPGHDPMSRLFYLKLVQVCWKPRLLWTGHFGGHLSCNAPLFVLNEIAPRVQLTPK
jgi:pimeloyl-ACP methyl ester carboxylesterase